MGYLLLPHIAGFAWHSRAIVRALWCCVLGSSIALVCHPLVAQEVSFTPRYEGITPSPRRGKKIPTVTPEPVQAPKLYSLARFNNRFQDMCGLLEADRRRERFFGVVKLAADEEKACSSCRALFRQLAQSCRPKLKAKREPSPTVEVTQEQASTPDGQGALVRPVQEGAPTIAPKRYPRTDLIEVLSLLSNELYEFGPGKGPVFDALKSLEARLTSEPTFTAGERDYFGIVMTYLFAAWAGRPGSPLESVTPSPEEIAELFQ